MATYLISDADCCCYCSQGKARAVSHNPLQRLSVVSAAGAAGPIQGTDNKAHFFDTVEPGTSNYIGWLDDWDWILEDVFVSASVICGDTLSPSLFSIRCRLWCNSPGSVQYDPTQATNIWLLAAEAGWIGIDDAHPGPWCTGVWWCGYYAPSSDTYVDHGVPVQITVDENGLMHGTFAVRLLAANNSDGWCGDSVDITFKLN